MPKRENVGKAAAILLAEDRLDDIDLMRLAIKKAGISNPLFVVRDGQEACDYLEGNEPYGDRATCPLRGLLLLDVQMPRMDGFDVLAWLRTAPDLKTLPVVMLSTSDLNEDVERAKKLGATDYRVKPLGLNALAEILKDLQSRWLAEKSTKR